MALCVGPSRVEEREASRGRVETGRDERVTCFHDGVTHFAVLCVRYGAGVYTYADSSKYDGAWQDDKQHGQGASRVRLLSSCVLCTECVV